MGYQLAVVEAVESEGMLELLDTQCTDTELLHRKQYTKEKSR
jgi:hypothetical protein